MARGKRTQVKVEPSDPPAKAIRRLRKSLEKGQPFLAATQRPTEAWTAGAIDALTRAFGDPSVFLEQFRNASLGPLVVNAPKRMIDAAVLDQHRARMGILESAIESLELDIEDHEPAAEPVPEPRFGSKVFLVHGHDHGLLGEVERYLRGLRLNVVILKEEPDGGDTIIEKFERYAEEAGFAVVLMTPDDVGGTKGSVLADLQPRARQNVVLELGYFMKGLGRARVRALYDGVELPSDYAGVLFIPVSGTWKSKLRQELEHVGLVR